MRFECPEFGEDNCNTIIDMNEGPTFLEHHYEKHCPKDGSCKCGWQYMNDGDEEWEMDCIE